MITERACSPQLCPLTCDVLPVSVQVLDIGTLVGAFTTALVATGAPGTPAPIGRSSSFHHQRVSMFLWQQQQQCVHASGSSSSIFFWTWPLSSLTLLPPPLPQTLKLQLTKTATGPWSSCPEYGSELMECVLPLVSGTKATPSKVKGWIVQVIATQQLRRKGLNLLAHRVDRSKLTAGADPAPLNPVPEYSDGDMVEQLVSVVKPILQFLPGASLSVLQKGSRDEFIEL